MKLVLNSFFIALFFMVSLSSCSNQDDGFLKKDTSNKAFERGAVECTNPRPEFCTREYMPVCGTRDTGVRCITTPCPSTELKTYPNKCEACSDEKVLSYIPGKCE